MWDASGDIETDNKKLRYHEEHSAFVELSWSTFYFLTLSGDKQQNITTVKVIH